MKVAFMLGLLNGTKFSGDKSMLGVIFKFSSDCFYNLNQFHFHFQKVLIMCNKIDLPATEIKICDLTMWNKNFKTVFKVF